MAGLESNVLRTDETKTNSSKQGGGGMMMRALPSQTLLKLGPKPKVMERSSQSPDLNLTEKLSRSNVLKKSGAGFLHLNPNET